MMWHLAVEVPMVVGLAFVAGGFWACLKAPRHFRALLADQKEIRRIISVMGFDKLSAEAQGVNPISDKHSYGDSIVIWDKAHFVSLSQTRTTLLILVVVIFLTSWFLGVWYFVANFLIFASLGLSGLPASAKNNNARHLPLVIMNLIKWRQEDEQACTKFCEQQHAEYRGLYRVVVSLQRETTGGGTAQ